MRPSREMVPIVLAFCCAASSLLSSRSEAAPGDGRLLRRWTDGADPKAIYSRAVTSAEAENVAAAAPSDLALELVLVTSAARISRSLEGPHEERWDGIPAGQAWLERRQVGGEALRRWELAIGAEVLTTATLDLEALRLDLDRGPATAAEPFGQWQRWTSESLRRLPGAGEESVVRLDPLGPMAATLDGDRFGVAGRLRPRRFAMDAAPLAYQTPLGLTSAAIENVDPWLVTSRSVAPDHPELELFYSGGNGGRHRLNLLSGIHREQGLGALTMLGPFEGTADVELETSGDAGPLGIARKKLEHNQLDAVEARIDLRFRPGGAPESGAPLSRGLARVGVYASALEREYALSEFSLASAHGPLEKRADVLARASYDFAVGPLDFSAGGQLSRSFLETGDGVAFDLFEDYRASGDNAATTSDGLHWAGDNPATGVDEAHLWNYYLRDLSTGTTLTLDGRLSPTQESDGPHARGIRFGAARRALTWRVYDYLDPKDAFRGVTGGGFEYANVLGYSRDGDKQEEPDGAAARHPVWTSFFATERMEMGPATVEAGARYRHFRAGQRPFASLDAPTGADTLYDAGDLADAKSQSSVDPRVGLSWRLPQGTRLWVDGGLFREEPPLEAVYYSPALVQALDLHAREGQLSIGREFVVGNPLLEPEKTTRVHLGVAHTMSPRLDLSLSASMDHVTDSWVARAHGTGRDDVLFYENGGERTSRALVADVTWRSKGSARMRVIYRVGRDETDHLEPWPLLRASHDPSLPAMSSGVNEAALGYVPWIDDGEDHDAFPALGDRTHRLAIVYEGTIAPGSTFGSLLPNVDVTLSLRAASGLPYTRTYVRPEGAIASLSSAPQPADPNDLQGERTAGAFQVDAALEHEAKFYGRPVRLRLEARNLFDQRTPRAVYGATGEADDDGYLGSEAGQAEVAQRGSEFASDYRDRIENPLLFEEGFVARFAVSLSY